jgi:TonB-dependent starch-binding outer membrane protein SusC
MKNNEPFRGNLFKHLKKTLRIMRIAIILILAGFFQTRANDAYSQNTRLSINFSNTQLVTVLDKIENQSEFFFLYNEKLIDANRKVSIDAKNQGVEDILKTLFEGTDVKYMILDRKIILSPDEISISQQQGKTITGNVKDNNGMPIPGASVSIKGTSSGTITDANGNFSLSNTPVDAILLFSFVGMKTQEISVGNKTFLNVLLSEEIIGLNEVVAIGYGTTRKKDLTGAVATVSSKELENRPSTQFGNALEGKVAGVQVIRPSGQPQAGFSIKIRGTSSITSGSDPLYIVDGVQTYSISEINPSDIESFSVLKDASSAAIYGSSGANGVVLITTKHGSNQKTKVSLNMSTMNSQVWKKLPVLNSTQFHDLANELGLSTDWNLYNANTNWQNVIFRNAPTQNYQVSMAGGDEKTDYYLSGSFIDQNGIVQNNSLKRSTFKLNLNHTVSKFLKVGTNLSYDNWSDVSVPENDRNGVVTRLLTTVPIIGIWDKTNTDQYALNPFIPDLENPYSTVYQPAVQYKNNRMHGNIFAEATITKEFKFKSLLGFEHSNGVYSSFQNPTQTRYGRSMDGLAAETDNEFTYWISENTLNFNKKIGNHSLSILGGVMASKENARSLSISSHGFGGSTAITTVTAGTVQAVPQVGIYEKSHAAYIARLNYSYKDKYLLTSNFRADGSGQFASTNRWGYFPSFSGGWRISKENFLADVSVISDLKLRAGWGTVGNDKANPYAWFGLLNPGSYITGGNAINAYIPNTLENTNLKWEKTDQLNIGIDIALFENRVSIMADHYQKTTRDLLLYVPQPLSTGFSTALQNAGSLQNKGFEFQIASKTIVHHDFKWSTDFNFYVNKGKVLDIVGTTIHTGAVNPAGTTYNLAYVKAGLPLGSFFGKFDQGVDPTTGNIKYLQNTAGSDSLGVIGNANPKFSYGMTNSFEYKNFVFDIFIQGTEGNQIFNATRILTESMRLGMNQAASVANRWKNPGDITAVPRAIKNDETNSYPSTRFIEKGSYLRVKSMTLGYHFPKSVLDRMKISSLMIYVTAENLFTFTKYSGFDPDVNAFAASSQDNTSKNTAPGVDYGTYPQSKDLLFGLKVSF